MNLRSFLTTLPIVLLLAFFPGHVFSQSLSYFPHRLIIKFEEDAQLNSIRNKSGVDPRQRVSEFLNLYGAGRMQPLLNPNLQQKVKSRSGFNSGSPKGGLSRIYEIQYLSDADPRVLAAKISKMEGIEYAEPRYIRHMQVIPNDPVDNPYLDFHNFEEAWNITMGSGDVVIAVVDGGVGYTHEDLDEKMWINTDEIPAGVRPQVDQDGNGTVTSGEVIVYLELNDEDNNGDGFITLEDALPVSSSLANGSDTDGNGFVDDLFGWNFWASGGNNGQQVETNNNPIHDATSHGTHVAGIAAAETDNGQDMYSTGWNVRYMAVKAGGTESNPTAIGFGYEGILYAASAGADIINCSWGGAGFSQMEQDVIEFATSMGSLVVAAAGNENVDRVIFPAGFDHVLSVGAVETTNELADYSNYGYGLDVLATGTGIRSTVFNDAVESSSGTSMSTPVASGLAGLVKSLHPDWSPLRIATQIRATATPVRANNPQLSAHVLGNGKLNAYEALNTEKPGIMVEDVDFVNGEGEKLGRGEQGFIRVTLVNYGSPTDNLSLDIQSLNEEEVGLGEQSLQPGILGTGDTTIVSFELLIPEEYDLNRVPIFRLDFGDSSNLYNDFAILRYQNILYGVMDVNDVIASYGSDGTVGFTELGDLQTGVGFIPREPEGSGENVLFEGGLMMYANREMYDAVRSTGNNVSRDFEPRQVYRIEEPGSVSDQDGHTRFSVSDSSTGTFATIDMDTYAYENPGRNNVIYVKYTITNTSEFALIRDMYLGLFNDWDIGGDPSANGVSFSAPDTIMYAFDETGGGGPPVMAVAHLGPVSSAIGINNALEGGQDSVMFGLYDGFTNKEKRIALTAGIENIEITGTDVSIVTGSGPYTLNPQASIVAGFVYAFGEDVEQLRTQIENAREQAPFETSKTGLAVSEEIPPATRLFQNYPNPFSRTTNFRVDLQEPSDVKLTLYNVLGQEVKVLVNQQLDARTHIFTFTNDNLSSGVYFARLKTDEGTQTVPITLIK